MRILHIVPTVVGNDAFGGVLTYAYGLTKALVRSGHRVEVICTGNAGTRALPWERTTAVPLTGPLGISPLYRSRLAAVNDRFAPEAVHVHGTFNYFSDVGAAVAAQWGVPVVQSPHGALGRSDIRARRFLLKRTYMNTALRRLHPRISLHFLSSEEARASEYMGAREVVCASPGVDAPALMTKMEIASRLSALSTRLVNRPYILFLARVSHHKGADLLMDGFNQAVRHDARWRDVALVFAGWEQDKILPLRVNGRPAWLDDRVFVAGPVDDPHTKQALLQGARLVAAPSRWESFGYTVVEAGLSARPVVFGADGLKAFQWEEAGAVVLTKTDVPRSVGATIVSVLEMSEDQRIELGMRARRYFASEYGWHKTLETILAAYGKAPQPT